MGNSRQAWLWRTQTCSTIHLYIFKVDDIVQTAKGGGMLKTDMYNCLWALKFLTRRCLLLAACIAPSYLSPRGGWWPRTRQSFHWAAGCYSARPLYFLYCYTRGWVVFWTHFEDLPCFSRQWASLNSATLVHTNFLRADHEPGMRATSGARRSSQSIQVTGHESVSFTSSAIFKRVEKAWTSSVLILTGFRTNFASAHDIKLSLACCPWTSWPV